MTLLMGQESLPVCHWREPEVSQHSFLLRLLTLMSSVARKYPWKVHELALQINEPDLQNHIGRFIFSQLHPHDPFPTRDQDMSRYTLFENKVSVFHSAVATYYAPSDHSGICGMHKQRI